MSNNQLTLNEERPRINSTRSHLVFLGRFTLAAMVKGLVGGKKHRSPFWSKDP